MEPDNDPNIFPAAEPNPPALQLENSPRVRGIAPIWHTVILIAVIVGVSLLGVHRHPGGQGIGAGNRLRTYGTTAVLELVLVGWVVFGLKLRKISVRSLIGKVSISFRSIAIDAGIAILFWIGSMMALASIAMMWISIESLITHKPIPIQTSKSGQPTLPKTPETQAARAVVQLAPENGKEIASWLLLCVLVGFAEELVFRGYFQSQFIAWGRGALWAGVVFSALMFGAAHGYEGVRAMFLLSVFGAFFSLLAIFRRSLRAGMFAHTWHDAFAGLMVAFLHSRHVL
jgi:membrane protease YdiL (CAAX protease family)